MSIEKVIRIIKKVLWSAYLVFLIFLLGCQVSVLQTFSEIIDVMVSVPSLVCLYIFIFRKKLLVVEFWRSFFFVFMTWNLYRNIILESFNTSFHILDILAYILLLCPLYYALYKVAFSSKSPLSEA